MSNYQLTKRIREIVDLIENKNFTFKKTSEIYGITPGRVRQLYIKAKRKQRKYDEFNKKGIE